MAVWPTGEWAADEARRITRIEASAFIALGLANLGIAASLFGFMPDVDTLPFLASAFVFLVALAAVSSGAGLLLGARFWIEGQLTSIDDERFSANPGKLWEVMNRSLDNVDVVGRAGAGMTVIGLATSLLVAWRSTGYLFLAVVAVAPVLYSAIVVYRAVRGLYRIFFRPGAWRLPAALRERFPLGEVTVYDPASDALRFGWRKLGRAEREQLLTKLDSMSDFEDRLDAALKAMDHHFIKARTHDLG